LGLEELSSLNVKSRFQAFENATTNGNSHMEKSPVSVKRSPSILSKLAKYVFLFSSKEDTSPLFVVSVLQVHNIANLLTEVGLKMRVNLCKYYEN